MATIKLLLRPSVVEGGEARLFLRVIHLRRPKTATLRYRLFPHEWDTKRQMVIFPDNDPGRKTYLAGIQEKLNRYVIKLREIISFLDGRDSYTADDIIAHFHNRAKSGGTFAGFVDMLANELRKRGQHRTAAAYLTACRRITAFADNERLLFSSIDRDFIRQFEKQLMEQGRMPNTVSFYMRNLRAIYNKAVEANYIPPAAKNPFSGVFTGVKETKKRALSAADAHRVLGIDFDTLCEKCGGNKAKIKNLMSLRDAHRYFFFCIYAHGMSFKDMVFLKKANISNGSIYYYRKKTGTHIIVPVNKAMREIIDYYAQTNPDSPYVFPIIKEDGRDKNSIYDSALRAQNARLTKIMALAMIESHLSTHVARHSWATICKNIGVHMVAISEALGHSSEMMTRKYLATLEMNILADAGNAVIQAIYDSDPK